LIRQEVATVADNQTLDRRDHSQALRRRIEDAFPEHWWEWSIWDLAERLADATTGDAHYDSPNRVGSSDPGLSGSPEPGPDLAAFRSMELPSA